MEEALRNADRLIAQLNHVCGLDYSPARERLAIEIWWEGFWEGNCDVTVDVEGLRPIRCIQEDHYDQHMDEDDDRPEWGDMLFSNPEYTWLV